ncbi:hypothetical protein CEXT_476261 [Caerostris extrusa]|uniref:Uncharacterized protein n=1 Tax=Caerostris extrusa TaxID=172846 RepID=A0AAV4WJL1_CAEEX|nr:hypothetical protein CEXT_476261 [Caerostris extrusa]
MENLKRPTQEETDDDLLKQQELFMKEKTKSGVNLTKKYEQQNTSNVKQEIQDSFKKEDTLDICQEVKFLLYVLVAHTYGLGNI